MNEYALIAGMCAAGASLFGKLAGNSEFGFNLSISVFCLVIMIALNAVMWTFYSKALNLSDTSIGPTVTSAAINFIFSGILGALIFGEKPSLLWWTSMCFVLVGLLFIIKGSKTILKQNKKE
ncbi:transmembrane protein 42 [Arctopsyche grandis]|uniref:transmembrane protein 42 n=1 Tax=Arctopsyche grandis TaxID=121162 RepID=UPI00406D8645